MQRSKPPARSLLVLCAVALALLALTTQMVLLGNLPVHATSSLTLGRTAQALHTALTRVHAALAAPDRNPLRDVWKRVQKADAYRFTARIEMTLIPRATSDMIGQTDQRVTLRLDGEQFAPDHSRATLRLADDPAAPALHIEQQGRRVTVTQGDQRLERDLPLDPATLTSSFLHLLAAATDVRELPPESAALSMTDDASRATQDHPIKREDVKRITPHVSRFAFRVDGSRLAQIYAEKVADELRRAAQVPDLDVTLPAAVAGTVGTGELWVGENGLPLRQVLDLDLPAASDYYAARAHIVIDYTFPQNAAATNSAARARVLPGLPALPAITFPISLTEFFLFLLSVALACALIAYRTHRRAYAIVAISLSIIIVITPVLRSLNIIRAYERIAFAETQQLAVSGQPLADSSQQLADDEFTSYASRFTSSTSHVASAASSEPDVYCGSGDANTDTDRDGINDRDENCLGTDPYQADTDYDHIEDKTELDGVEWPQGSGQMWYGNPISTDTNKDGLSDVDEWPGPDGTAPEWDVDNDGIPNPWDDDNDGDGVPDREDISPYAYTRSGDSFRLATQGHGISGYEYIQIQVRPKDPSHLRYTAAHLDWPQDTKGTIKEYDEGTDDVRLVPMLRIVANVAPPSDLAKRYGVTARKNDDGTYTLRLPLNPVIHHGTNVAFTGQVVYAPDQLADIRWEGVSFVWTVMLDYYTNESDHTWTALTAYEDEFTVTGLNIFVQKSLQNAIFGTPDFPNDDRILFNMALGASSTFTRYRDRTLDDLANRFTCTSNCDPIATWGADPRTVEVDGPVSYQDRDEALLDTSERAEQFLQNQGYPTDSHPALITAMEDVSGVWSLDSDQHGQVEARANLSLLNMSFVTMRYLRLNTYEYRHGSWQSLATAPMLQVILDRYSEDTLAPVVQDLRATYPDITARDLRATLAMFYTSWQAGYSRITRVDGRESLEDAPTDLDQSVYDRLHQPDPPYDNLAAYLVEVAELAEPGGGMRVGASRAQEYTYRHAHPAGVRDLHVPPMDIQDVSYNFIPTTGNVIPPYVYAVRATLASISMGYTYYDEMKRLGSLFKIDKISNHKLGVVGAIGTIIATWIFFGVSTDFSNPIAWHYALSYAIASTVISILFFVLSLSPFFAVLLIYFSVIDLIILIVTWGGFSLMAWITDFLAKMFYTAKVETYLHDMELYNSKTSLTDKERGPVAGNSFQLQQTLWAQFYGTEAAELDDLEKSDASGKLYPSYPDGKTSYGTLSRTPESEEWYEQIVVEDLWARYYLPRAERDVALSVFPEFEITVVYDSCGLWGLVCSDDLMTYEMPEDMDPEQQWGAQEFYVDVLPNTLEGLWTWDELSNLDIDGDGLTNDQETRLGTNPDRWDTDADGLPDLFEVEHRDDLGTDPLDPDTDDDGLSDSQEYDVGTLINDPDSDNDGLTDGEEVFHQDTVDTNNNGNTDEWMGGGWFVANLPETSQTYWIYSDPTSKDPDADVLSDASERAYRTSPQAYNKFPQMSLQVDPLAVSPAGVESTYLKPGDSVTVTLTLENTGPQPVTTTLTLCLPDFLTDLQGGQMQGDRQPSRQDAASCHGFQWSFSGANTLQRYESVRTEVRATAANVPSAQGEITAAFPYIRGKEIRQTASVVLDNDVPSADFLTPLDGAVIGGGISDYVIGGTSGDDTTWVTRVHLDLPNATADITDTVNPWAYTWNLPADGVYTLQAAATDFVGNTSPAASVQVTVDNTAPQVDTSFPDRSYLRGDAGNVITVTVTGTATDNLSGLVAVQASLDDKPWREVWTSTTYPLNTSWTTQWTLPNAESASGEHVARIRALDRAGNMATITRTFIVDVLPPTTELSNRIYATDPPHVLAGQAHTLYGVANDAGRAPKPPHPQELVGRLHSLDDATIWLGLPNVRDNDSGVILAWLGDFNNDRLADAVLGLPAANGGKGRVVIVYGRAGNWPAPTDVEDIARSPSILAGADGAALGRALAPVGDVNGDSYDDLLLGDPNHKRAFLVFGGPQALGHDVTMNEANRPYWIVLSRYDGGELAAAVAPAGDVNADGYTDMLIASGTTVYLLLGESDFRFDTVYVDRQAAAAIDAGSADARFAGVGDVDNDGYDDFAVAVGNTVYLFLGNGDFAVTPPDPTGMALNDADATFASDTTNPQVVRLGDVNGDGVDDFIYESGNAPKLVFGSASHTWTTHTFDNFDPSPSGFIAGVGDVDNDGRADILMQTGNGNAYLVLGSNLNQVAATFTAVAAAAYTLYSAGADINSDGASDILLYPDTSAGAQYGMASKAARPFGDPNIVAPDHLPRRPARVLRFTHYALRSTPDTQPNAATQSTLYVDDDPTCAGLTPCYTDIQSAVDAASAGDTIVVRPGGYPPFAINGKDNLTVQGVDPNAVFINGGGTAYGVKIANAMGVTVEKITVRDADVGVLLDHAGQGGYNNQSLVTHLQNLFIYNTTAHAVQMDRTSTARITDSTFVGTGRHIEVTGADTAPSDWDRVDAADTPSVHLSGGITAEGGKIYFAAGKGSKEFHVYDPNTNTWTQLTDVPEIGAMDKYASNPAGDGQGHVFLFPIHSRDFYMYDIASNAWSQKADFPDDWDVMTLAGDGQGNILALYHRPNCSVSCSYVYRYSYASNTWTQYTGPLPYSTGGGQALVWARGTVFAFVGANMSRFYKWDGTKWQRLADLLWPAQAGASLWWDGDRWIYALFGGNTTYFARYDLNLDSWEILGDGDSATTDDDDFPSPAAPGASLAGIGNDLYAVPAGRKAELLHYSNVGIYWQKLTLERNAFVVPDVATRGDWYTFDLAHQPDDFQVDGADNAWVGGSGTTWTPDPTAWPYGTLGTVTDYAAADFLNPAHDNYRMGTDRTLNVGYSFITTDTVTVPDNYASIQDAIDSGARRVLIKPGQYAEAFYLVSGVEVVGSRADRTIIAPPPGHAGPLVQAEGVVDASLKGVTLNGGGTVAGFHGDDGATHTTLYRTIVRNATTGVLLEDSGTQVEVVNTTIVKNDKGLVAANGAALNVRNTIFAYNTTTGLDFSGAGPNPLHTYNDYWANGTDLVPNDPGAAEIFLDPQFVDPSNDNYYPGEGSPVIDAGNPNDPHPPGTGEVVDMGYIEQGRAAMYVDDDYCPDCLNDGLTWGVDAFADIQQALDKAGQEQIDYGEAHLGSVTCRTYRSSAVPRTIPTDTTKTLRVPINVNLTGPTVDLRVHSLRGRHDNLADLQFRLLNPSGGSVTLLTPTCPVSGNIDVNFRDGAANPAPCPPDDGGTYRPQEQLSGYVGDEAQGTWFLVVEDQQAGAGGSVDAWGLTVCTQDMPAPITVGVGAGVYTGTVSVPGRVHLVGVDADQVVLNGNNAGYTVLFDGVAHAAVRNLTITGNPDAVGVWMDNKAHDIHIERNLIRGNNVGVHVQNGANGFLAFNTITGRGRPGGAKGLAAVSLQDEGSQIVSRNNIFDAYAGGVNGTVDAIAYSDYDLYATEEPGNVNYLYYLRRGPHTRDVADAGFVSSTDEHLRQDSPAVDAASPDADVPPGGGARADQGYKELVALPATVFLGREGPSTTVGNSGVKHVDVAMVPVADLRTAVDETPPGTWTSVYDDPTASETKVYWQTSVTPTTEGLYRVYGKGEDRVGNVTTDAADWYMGAFVADGTPPAVAMVSPTPGASVLSPLDLRATVTDTVAGQFSVQTIQFEVDGQSYDAAWTGEPWDPNAGLPRPFHRWMDLAPGAHTIIAVAYDRAGNRGESAPVVINVTAQTGADTIAPTLTISHPVSGQAVQFPVIFEGTANDGESGLLSVEVSLDGGVTWRPATVTGSTWRLTWNPSLERDYIFYPGKVRARDKAGNVTVNDIPFVVDNVAPKAWRTPTYTYFDGRTKDAPPGTHFDQPTVVMYQVPRAYDGSDPYGYDLEMQSFADQQPKAVPSPVLPWKTGADAYDVNHQAAFSLPGKWYIHVFYRDSLGNVLATHYGPWYVSDFLSTTTDCVQRRQSIQVDGFMDTEHNEWTINEYMDDDVRGMEKGHPRQSLYITWAGRAVYVGWRGAWWGADGTMWVYITTDVDNVYGIATTVDGRHTLPFKATTAVHILDATTGELYRWDSSTNGWSAPTTVLFANGATGDTEIRIPWDRPIDEVGAARLLAYAEDPEGRRWSAFPTTNALEGDLHDYYQFRNLCDPLLAFAAPRPVREWIEMNIDPAYPDLAPLGPGVPVTYTFMLRNMELVTVPVTSLILTATQGLSLTQISGLTCTQCPPLGNLWSLDIPQLAPSATLPITITGVITGNLANIAQVWLTATQFYSTTVLDTLGVSQAIDNRPPEVHITTPPDAFIGTGVQQVMGTMTDFTGAGAALVTYSTDGGNTWQPAAGTLNWVAPVNVPANVPTFEVRVRAVDIFGQVGETSKTFYVDTQAPQVDVNIPAYLTGTVGVISGQVVDVTPVLQGLQNIAWVGYQFFDDPTLWNDAILSAPDANGVANWVATWPLPPADGITQTLRFQAADLAGNITTTLWYTVTIDNVAPTVTVTQTVTQLSLNDPGQPVVLQGLATDGTGIQDITLFLYGPDGSEQQIPLSWTPTVTNTVTWQYMPDLNTLALGDYTLRVRITDLAGNVRNLGPYSMSVVSCLTPDLVATFVTAEPMTDTIRIDVRVDNAGGGLPAGLPVAFYMDDALIGTATTTQTLSAGQSETVSVVWDVAGPGDYQLRIALNDDGTGGALLNLCTTPPQTQQPISILDVPLVESWNLMSTYVNPFNTNASVVQLPIAGQYVVIQGFEQEAQSYYPDLPPAVNTLKDVDAEHGYWVKVKEIQGHLEELRGTGAVATWRFVGTKFAEDRPIPLDAGWNLVSFLPRASMPVTQALQSIEGLYTAVLGFEQGALSYYPDLDPSFNTLHEMKPLFGYWIRMAQAGTLQYPTTTQEGGLGKLWGTQGNLGSSASPPSSPKLLRVPPSPTWVNFYGAAYLPDGTPLPVGTTVLALDTDGVVCGSTVVTIEGQYGLLACYGDDPTTPENEGAQPGDTIQLVVEGQVLGVGTWTEHGDCHWRPLGKVEMWQVYLPLIRKGE